MSPEHKHKEHANGNDVLKHEEIQSTHSTTKAPTVPHVYHANFSDILKFEGI